MAIEFDIFKLKQLWNREHYTKMLYSLLPYGLIWRPRQWSIGEFIQDIYEGTVDWEDTYDSEDDIQDVMNGGAGSGDMLMRIFAALAVTFERIESDVWKMINETDPGVATDLLADWEVDLGIPESCFQNINLSIEDRQRIAHAKHFQSSQTTNEQWYIDYADAMGFLITIEESPVETEPAICGVAICGVARCGGRGGYSVMEITIVSGDGNSLVLICMLNKLKQAHVIITWIDLTTARMTWLGAVDSEITVRGPSGNTIEMSWDDGYAIDSYSLLGTGTPVTMSHAYGASEEYDIQIRGDIDAITYFYCVSQGVTDISSLSGLSGMSNIESLYLQGNSIIDVSALASLTSLTYLNLYSNSIIDVSALASLTSLTYLHIGNNSITNIAGLQYLINLTSLYFSGNSVEDISYLSGMTSMTALVFDNNSAEDISYLSGMTSMITLSAANNGITDISALSVMTSLQNLWLYNNEIVDISPLVNLSSLNLLLIYGNNITYTTLNWPTYDGIDFRAYSCGLSSTEVDQWIIDADSDSWVNGTLRWDGTNAAHTGGAPVLAAIAALVSAGNSVAVNAP